MSWIKPLACLFILLVATQAYADDIACNPNGNQRELNVCSAEAQHNSEVGLMKIYKEEMRRLKDPAARERFKASQDVWFTFRQLNCDYVIGPEQGTGYFLFYNSCLDKMNEERVKEITGYISCQERGSGSRPQ